jgi:autotransporter-associated beta strand protein
MNGSNSFTMSGTGALGANTLTVANTANTITLSGVISGGSSGSNITQNGLGGTLALTAANTYSGTTILTAGTLALGNNAALGSGDLSMGGGSLQASTTLTNVTNNFILTAPSTMNGSNSFTMSGTGALGANTLTVANTANIITLSGVISGSGGITRNGTGGALILSAANTYTGVTTISAGTLQTGVINATANSSAVTLADTSGAIFNLNGFNQTITNLSGGGASGGNITLGTATLSVNQATPLTYAGVISGVGGNLTKTGSATLTLTGTNIYTGVTTISAGTLQTGVVNAIANSSAVTLANTSGVVFNLNGFNQAINNLSGGGASGGNITLGTATLTLNQSSALTYAGVVSGAGGSLTKIGSATLILTGSNTYDGGTTVTAGTLQASGTNLPSGGTLSVGVSGTLALTGGTVTGLLNNAGNVNTAGIITPAASSLNSGTISISSGGELTIPSSFTSAAGTIITNGTGVLTVNNALSGIVTNNGTTIVAAAFTPANTSSNSVGGIMTINSGGSFTQPAVYTYSGTINVNDGGTPFGATLTGNAGSILNVGYSNSVTFTTAYSIVDVETINILTSGTSFTANNAISGVDTLFLAAAGTTTNINAAYSGTGLVNNSGLFVIDNTFTSGVITNASGGVLELATNAVVSNTINNQVGATLNITGAGSGPINNAGTLNIINDLVATGNIDNSGLINMQNIISMPGFTLTNTGTIDVHGTQTLSALSFVSPGIQNYTITNNLISDKLTADCPINLTNGTVNITSSFFGPDGSAFTWDILIGTSITTSGTTINIPASGMLGTWSEQIIGGNTLRVAYNRGGSSNSFVPPPGVPTQIANILDEMSNGNINPGQAALLLAVNTVSTQAQYDYILNNLQPNTTTSSVTRAMQNIGFNKIESRVAGIKKSRKTKKHRIKKSSNKKVNNKKSNTSGMATGDITHNTAMWMSGLGSLSKQHTNGDNQGYRAKILGGMLGFDFRAKNDSVYGIALGISNANVYALVNTTNNTRVLGYNLMAYGANKLPRNYFTEWIVSGVINKNYGVRVFGINGIDLSTSASYRGALGGARINVGKMYAVNNFFNLSPIAMAQYVLVHQSAYDEDNSVAALHVATKTNQSILTLGAGFRIGKFNNDIWRNGTRELSAMLTYDALSPQQATTANFVVGSNAFTMVSSPARLALKLAADYGLNFYKNLDLQLKYSYEMRSGYYDNFAEIKLRYLF